MIAQCGSATTKEYEYSPKFQDDNVLMHIAKQIQERLTYTKMNFPHGHSNHNRIFMGGAGLQTE